MPDPLKGISVVELGFWIAEPPSDVRRRGILIAQCGRLDVHALRDFERSKPRVEAGAPELGQHSEGDPAELRGDGS